MTATDLRGRRDLGEIIGLSYRLYVANFAPLFLMALTVAPLQVLSAVVQDRIASVENQQLAATAFLPFSVVVSLIATGALIHAVNDIATGTPPTFSRSIDAAFERFVALLATNLLGGVLAILSLLAFPYFALRFVLTRKDPRMLYLSLLGFPYFAVRWTFSPQAVVIEGKRHWAALDISSSIVKGQWWRTFGMLVVITLIGTGPLLLARAVSLLPALPSSAILAALVALTLPFLVAAQTLLYYDLRARKAAADAPLPVLEPSPETEPGAGMGDGDQ
ncbi:MAG: hypothetical protein HY874_12235 [Chloroflexi bacterium]|nr:hypothetical protein [Chloroflexota bacterium]